jgi:hypothetical protein
MITIDVEAKGRIRHPIEIDRMAERYKNVNKTYTFTSPSLWVYEKNLFYLLKNSEVVDFDPKYFMRPDYLSFDSYGVVTLGQLLMYVNNVGAIEDFDLDKVVIPSFQSIVDICRDKYPDINPSELTEINW